MELMHIFLIFSLDFLSVMLVTGKPDPPKDVRIHVIGSKAKISWIIPSNIEGATYSRIYINDSEKGDEYLGGTHKNKDIPIAKSTFEIDTLKMCSEYYVRIGFINPSSEYTTQKFWMTNTTFFADINQNVAISWTTSMTAFFNVTSPSNLVIYEVQVNSIISAKERKYIFDEKTNNVQAINITVIKANKTDAGIYRAVGNGNVNGCCLLVVTTRPMKPTLTFHPVHPFVDSSITFICNFTVQRWPDYVSSNMSYHYFGNPRGDLNYNTLTLHTVTKSDKGIQITCKASDDRGKVSSMSDTVTLDPYYSPKIRVFWLSDESETYVSNPTTYSFNEDVTQKITLRIDSNPDPQLVLNSSLLSFPKLTYTKSVTDFSSKLPALTCEDYGKFTIQAVNGIKNGDSRTFNLVINCQPRNVTVESTKLETEVNASKIIMMHVVSFPAPTVEWCRQTGFQWTVQKDKYDYRYRIQSEIHMKSKADFGEYGIKICNKLGCIVQNIILTSKGLFISPSYVYVVCRSTTATVIWIPDFIGGFSEDFYVQYTYMGTNNGSSNRILYNNTYQHMVYVVDGLHPDRRYDFTVLSVSVLGQLRSETVEFFTDVAYQSESCRAVTGMLATGLATLVVGLVAFVAATVFLIRNRLKYKKSKPNESEGYIEVQRSNPVFTEPYSTLQSQPESGPLQEPSTDTYDECGIAPDVDTYQSIEEGPLKAEPENVCKYKDKALC